MSKSNTKVKVKKATGVYYRESDSKRHRGKPDKCYYITYRNSTGKFVWEKIGWASEGYTAAFASNTRAERVRAIRHGEELPREKQKAVTFGEVWEKYDQWQETNLTWTRQNRYRYRIYLKKRFANKTLDQISPFDLEKLKSELHKKGKAPATIKHVLVLVRQLFNMAKAWGLYQGENPISSVKLPKFNNRRERFLTFEEAKILLQNLGELSPQTRDIALMSLHTGLRAGEIFSLRWGHIDTENKLIHVADSKSGHPRKANMTETLKDMFSKLEKGKPSEIVFKDRNGNKIERISATYYRLIITLGWNNGITDNRQRVSFHTLRHTFASWLAIQGTPILHIKELLGHQTLAMTERYSHLIPDVKRDAVAGLEKAFLAGRRSEPDSPQKTSPGQ